MQQLTRRKVVLGALGTGAVALAGCVSGNEDGNNPDDESNDQQSDDDQQDPAETRELDSSIKRVGSDCAGMGPGETAVFFDNGEYLVQGTIPSPTPCYEPTVDSHSFEDGTLSLTVDVTETGDDPCMDCVGEVLYDATISGPNSSDVDRVSVTHAGGKTHETPSEDIPGGVPELVEAEITDSESKPRDGNNSGTAEVAEINDSSDPGTITITGAIPTENPHYEAVLTGASVRAGTLSVTVAVESTLEDDQMGTMPLGLIEYTAVATIEQPAAIDSVQIRHPNASYGSAWASDSASATPADDGETSSDSGSSDSDRSR